MYAYLYRIQLNTILVMLFNFGNSIVVQYEYVDHLWCCFYHTINSCCYCLYFDALSPSNHASTHFHFCSY